MRRTLITTRARAMRKAMTEPEVMLWSRLRGRRGDRPTFRRQHPVGSLILDFYCPSLRFAVEVDGSTHWDDDAKLRDARRDHWLEAQGITVMRIPAGWILPRPQRGDGCDPRQGGGAATGSYGRAAARPLHPPLYGRLTPTSAGGPPPAASRGR